MGTDTFGTGTFVSGTLDTGTSDAAQWAQTFLAQALLSLALLTLKQLPRHSGHRHFWLWRICLRRTRYRHQRHGTVGTDIFGSSARVVGFVGTETIATAQWAQTLLALVHLSLAHSIQAPTTRHNGHRHFWLKHSCRWLC